MPAHSQVRGYFSASDELTFEQSGTYGGTVTINWWVVESDQGDFTVDEVDITIADTSSSNTGTIGAVTTAQSFLAAGSWTVHTDASDDNEDATIDAVLTNTTTVTIQRDSTGGAIVYTGYVVEFADSGVGNVQRGTITGQGATASQSIDITAVNLDYSWVHTAGNNSYHSSGSFPGTGTSDNADSQCAWDFVDTDTIRVQHSTNGAEADNDISWEVIEFEEITVGGATGKSNPLSGPFGGPFTAGSY